MTITGPGGVGKTRVLGELGRRLAPEFLGRCRVRRPGRRDRAGRLPPALAAALDVKESEEQDARRGHRRAGRRAGGRSCSSTTWSRSSTAPRPRSRGSSSAARSSGSSTTSRAPLRIAAEREYPLAPLEIDSAVELFAERARAAASLKRGGRGGDLPAPRRAAARARACRRAPAAPVAGRAARAARPRPRRAHLRSPATARSGSRRCARRSTGATRFSTSTSSVCSGAWPSSPAGARWPTSRRSVRTRRGLLDELESLVDKALVQVDGGAAGFGCCRRSASSRRNGSTSPARRARSRGDTHAAMQRSHARFATAIEGADQIGSVERGIAEEGNLQAALETLLAGARGGDAAACEGGMQLCGDLWMYWHIRGKNVSAREYAEAFLAASQALAPSVGRSGALITAGLASWMTGQIERANEEWGEAYRIAAEVGAGRELCLAAACQALGLLGVDIAGGARVDGARGIEQSARAGSTGRWASRLSFDGIAQDAGRRGRRAEARFAEALRIQEPARRLREGRHVARRSRPAGRRPRRIDDGARPLPAVAGGVRGGRRPRRGGADPLRDGLRPISRTGTPRSPAATSSRRCRRTPTSPACAAWGSRSSGSQPPRRSRPSRARRADRRRGRGVRPGGGHRHRLLRRDAGQRARRAGASSALSPDELASATESRRRASRSRRRSTSARPARAAAV